MITDNNNNNTIVPLATKLVLNAFADKSSDDDDNDNDELIVANQDVQDKDEYTVLFQTTKLGLDLITGGGREGVVVSKVYNEEFKHIIQLNDIVILIDNERLKPTTVLKDVFFLIEPSKRPLLIRFSRAKAKNTVQNRKKRTTRKRRKRKRWKEE